MELDLGLERFKKSEVGTKLGRISIYADKRLDESSEEPWKQGSCHWINIIMCNPACDNVMYTSFVVY